MYSNHLVTVIMSAYNAEQFIKETIESVLAQTYKNFELVIVNDGSTDQTLRVINQFGDHRIRTITQDNKGQDAALNEGYRSSKGDYIKFLDSDDLINPEMLQRQVESLHPDDDYVAYGEWDRFFNAQPELAKFEHLDYWRDMDPLDFLTASPDGIMLQCGIMLIPRKLIEKAGLWNESLILFNDTEFFTRVILASKGILFTPGARLYYRSGLKNSISAQGSRKFFESTFSAICLIGENMLAVEDSYRVRNLLSNMLLARYYAMYPCYRDLGKKHLQKVAEYGCATARPGGGLAFRWVSYALGWKNARIMQRLSYRLGYVTFLFPIKLFLRSLVAKSRAVGK